MTAALKAAGFNSCVAALRRMVDGAAFERFVSSLPEDQQQPILWPHIASAWIPAEIADAVMAAIHAGPLGGSDEKMFELGRQQIKDDMSTIYRFFLRIASPAYVLERATKIWDTYSREAGTLRVVKQRAKEVDIRVDNIFPRRPAFWPYLRGNIYGVLELTNVGELDVKVIDGGGAARFALMRASWK